MKAKYGLEFEFSSNRSQEYITDLLNRNGIHAENTHRARTGVWAVSYDGTIDTHDYNCHQIELKAPPLRIHELGQVKKVLDLLRTETESAVNYSCGTHTHIEIDNWETIKSIYYLWNHYEDTILGFLPHVRRSNGMAKKIKPRWERIWPSVREGHIPNDRYLMVNSHCFSRYGTVEFRGHSGTLNFNKIKRWILFCASLVELAKEFERWDTLALYLDMYRPDLFELLGMNGKTKRFLLGRTKHHASKNNSFKVNCTKWDY